MGICLCLQTFLCSRIHYNFCCYIFFTPIITTNLKYSVFAEKQWTSEVRPTVIVALVYQIAFCGEALEWEHSIYQHAICINGRQHSYADKGVTVMFSVLVWLHFHVILLMWSATPGNYHVLIVNAEREREWYLWIWNKTKTEGVKEVRDFS